MEAGLSSPVGGRTDMSIIGRRFGMLTVVGLHSNAKAMSYWNCACDCGGERVVVRSSLTGGCTTSCGCKSLAMKKRPVPNPTKSHTPEYMTWKHMRARCRKTVGKEYERYGSRGITVCERWEQFENFLADMGPKPSPLHSLDRINNDGNYEPGNCRWVTQSVQNSNRAKYRRSVWKRAAE
jgi:hypothetical protein